MNSLKFSIVTPSLNQGDTIRDTIESVLAQNYKNFEHIIIDGGSSDNTLEVLKNYPHLIWISEKDSGAANAINKGFSKAKGDIYSWINSDDYYEDNIFSQVESLFNNSNEIKLIFGNITIVNKDKSNHFRDKTVNFSKEFLINECADVIRQPGSFFTASLWNDSGGLDEELKLVFDYDLFLKMMDFTKPCFIDKNFAYYRDYENTLTRKFLRRQSLEIYKVSCKHGGNLFSKLNKRNLKKLFFNR